MKCLAFKKSGMKAMAKAPLKASPNDFGLVDNGDETASIVGVDAAGNPAPLDPAVFTLTIASDTPAVVTVDNTGLTFGEHAAVPAPAVNATAGITVTVTGTVPWADGTTTPKTLNWTDTILAGPAANVAIQRGPVSVH